jgi:hypothetical protein
MHFQKPNPWVECCVDYLKSGAYEHLHALNKLDGHVINKVNCFDLICFAENAGVACDTISPEVFEKRLKSLLKWKKAMTLISTMLLVRNIGRKQRSYIDRQCLGSSARVSLWGKVLIHCSYEKENRVLLDSLAINSVLRRLVLEFLAQNEHHMARVEAYRLDSQSQRHLDFFQEKVWEGNFRWLPHNDYEFLSTLVGSPIAAKFITAYMFGSIHLRFSFLGSGNKRSKDEAVTLIQLSGFAAMHRFKNPRYIRQAFDDLFFAAKLNPHPDIILAIQKGFDGLAGVDEQRLPAVLELLATCCCEQIELLGLYEARPTYTEVLGALPPTTAAKLVQFSTMRDHWLSMYPEIAEHLLAQELGL